MRRGRRSRRRSGRRGRGRAAIRANSRVRRRPRGGWLMSLMRRWRSSRIALLALRGIPAGRRRAGPGTAAGRRGAPGAVAGDHRVPAGVEGVLVLWHGDQCGLGLRGCAGRDGRGGGLAGADRPGDPRPGGAVDLRALRADRSLAGPAAGVEWHRCLHRVPRRDPGPGGAAAGEAVPAPPAWTAGRCAGAPVLHADETPAAPAAPCPMCTWRAPST